MFHKDGGKRQEDSTHEIRALAIVEGEILRISREYLLRGGFTEITIPHLTKATGACENMDTVFELRCFGRQAYLLQTGQLFLELLTPILGKVWCYGPSFRAEPKTDSRHLAEFGLLEMEFCGGFERLLSHIEDLISEIVKQILHFRLEELKILSVDCHRLYKIRPPFRRLTYDEAVSILDLEWGRDLNSKHETVLLKRFDIQPLFITHHPGQIKFFNMKTNEDDPRVVNSADLILPFCGEAIGAAEREIEYEKVCAKLERSNMLRQLRKRGGSIGDFDWYLRHLREGRSLPHAGFGMGVSRVTQFVLGRWDIRKSTLFPINRETIV